MNRARFYAKLWRDCRGILPAASKVAIAGGGISGLHLAWALSEYDVEVTIFEPAAVGGVRIPMMHACQTPKARTGLWQTAADFSRVWYDRLLKEGFPLCAGESSLGRFYTFQSRAYLRALISHLKERGVKFIRREFAHDLAADYDLHFRATGAAFQAMGFRFFSGATQQISGGESYAARSAVSGDLPPEKLMQLGKRLALVHDREATLPLQKTEALTVFSGGRVACFRDHRLVTRDRLPAIGFVPEPIFADYNEFRWHMISRNYAAESARAESAFAFLGMGYHAMTYAPYLAHRVATWLTAAPATHNADAADQNLVCALTPARFLPR